MEVVEQRYNNFQQWISTELAGQIPNSFLLSLVASVPLHTFLRKLYERAQAASLTVEQITSQVIAKTGLSRQDFSNAQIDRFQLYIEYFLHISDQLFSPVKK
jgi:hypothetical protein